MKRTSLSTADEAALIARHQAGDRLASTRLLIDHESFIRSIANQYRGRGVEQADLRQEARIALLSAALAWRPDGGARLATFAVLPMRRAIDEALRHGACATDVPWNKHERATRDARNGHEVPGWGRFPVRLDEPARKGGETTRGDRIPSDHPTAEEALVARQGSAILHAALASLPATQADIVRRRRLADEPELLQAIGLDYGVSGERIRQLEHAAILKLRQRMTTREAA